VLEKVLKNEFITLLFCFCFDDIFSSLRISVRKSVKEEIYINQMDQLFNESKK
jgi:hypothetical protein